MAARSVSGSTSHCGLTSECSSAWEATGPGLIAVYGRCRVLQQRTRVCLTVSAGENIEVVKLEILKVKTWFWNKDLSSLDSIN